ncbi:MAG: hypothetical protein JXR95_11430, partial [Deltaproteobacteria bacterium]|nr:hypothetical protein [Deltaproteobacteria bacterium]
MSSKMSLEGIVLLYVRRTTGKEFGPFPAEKILSLVKLGKITKDEMISQDKNIWIKISELKEFSEISESEKNNDLPGLKAGGESDLPGLKISGGSDLPGLKTGGESDL